MRQSMSLFFFFLSAIRANTAQSRADTRGIRLIRANSGRISLYRPQPPILAPNRLIQAKIQKKKKKKSCKTHHLGKNNKTLSLSQFSLLTDSFSHSHLQLSLTLCLWSLCSTALCLWPLLSVSPSPLSLTISLSHSHITISLSTH